MAKKIFALVLTVCVLSVVVGCGSKTDDSTAGTATTTAGGTATTTGATAGK